MSKRTKIAVWVGRIVVACLFLATGSSKLLGNPMMVDVFTKIGYGQGFRYFTGASEIVAAVLLLWPRTSLYGAIWALCIAVGAFFAQLLVLHGDVIHTIVLGIIALALIWAQKPSRPAAAT